MSKLIVETLPSGRTVRTLYTNDIREVNSLLDHDAIVVSASPEKKPLSVVIYEAKKAYREIDECSVEASQELRTLI